MVLLLLLLLLRLLPLLRLLLLLLLPLLQKDTKKQLRKGPGAPPWHHFLVKVLFETLLFSFMS